MCADDGRSNNWLNCTNNGKISCWYDLTKWFTGKQKRFVLFFWYWLNEHFTTSDSMSFYFKYCTMYTRFCSTHTQFDHFSSISEYDKLAAVCGLSVSTIFRRNQVKSMQFAWNSQTTNTNFDDDNDPIDIQYFAYTLLHANLSAYDFVPNWFFSAEHNCLSNQQNVHSLVQFTYGWCCSWNIDVTQKQADSVTYSFNLLMCLCPSVSSFLLKIA